jgi:hypothetical protein
MVNAPVTVTALYTTGVDFAVLGLIIAALIVIIAIIVIGRRISIGRSAKAKKNIEE